MRACRRCAALLPAAFQGPPPPYACHFCGSPAPPQIVKRLHAVGWIVFAVGLLFCLVGCLACLFFLQEHRVCPTCGNTVG
jgi:RNA polymerase subunit RPABC4/transcription elongation factor Spt4